MPAPFSFIKPPAGGGSLDSTATIDILNKLNLPIVGTYNGKNRYTGNNSFGQQIDVYYTGSAWQATWNGTTRTSASTSVDYPWLASPLGDWDVRKSGSFDLSNIQPSNGAISGHSLPIVGICSGGRNSYEIDGLFGTDTYWVYYDGTRWVQHMNRYDGKYNTDTYWYSSSTSVLYPWLAGTFTASPANGFGATLTIAKV
jgi:hypothetical protein